MTHDEIERLEEQLKGWRMRALDADAEIHRLREQLVCARGHIEALLGLELGSGERALAFILD